MLYNKYLSEKLEKKTAIIIGAGPAGLTAASSSWKNRHKAGNI